MTFPCIVIDSHLWRVYRDGHFANLAPIGFEMFHMMWRARGAPVSQERLRDFVYQLRLDCDKPEHDSVMRVHIRNLRRDLAPLGFAIRSQWGDGYYIERLPECPLSSQTARRHPKRRSCQRVAAVGASTSTPRPTAAAGTRRR